MRLLILAACAALLASSVSAQPDAVPPPAGAATDPAAYMAAVAKQPGVTVTSSGLAYKVLSAGPVTGARPRMGDQVRVSYVGRLTDGTVFDASDANGGPLVMTVGQLVPGWNEALQMMRPGDSWTLYLPPSLGYGDRGVGPIPPGSALVFDLQLIAIVSPDPG